MQNSLHFVCHFFSWIPIKYNRSVIEIQFFRTKNCCETIRFLPQHEHLSLIHIQMCIRDSCEGLGTSECCILLGEVKSSVVWQRHERRLDSKFCAAEWGRVVRGCKSNLDDVYVDVLTFPLHVVIFLFTPMCDRRCL